MEQTAEQHSLLKDLLPRFIGILAIILAGQTIFDTLSNTDKVYWQDLLEQKVEHAETFLTSSLSEKTATALTFSEDERLADAFSLEGDIEPLLRRPLYEFRYINSPEAAYVYDARSNNVALSTTNAAPLPANILNTLYDMASMNRSSYNDLIWDVGETKIMFAGAVLSLTGTVSGYALYTDYFSSVFQNARREISNLVDQHVQFDLYRLGNNNSAVVFENFATNSPYARQVFANKTPMPLFVERFPTDIYQNPQKDNQEYLVALKRLNGYENWAITAFVPKNQMTAHSNDARNIVWVVSVAVAILFFMIPLRGPYSDKLRKLYRSIAYTSQRKKNTQINQNDLERLRLGGAMASRQNSRTSNGNTAVSTATHATTTNNANSVKANYARPVNNIRPAGNGNKKKLAAPRKKLPVTFKPRPREDKPPSEAAIAYNIRTGMKNKRIKLMYQPIFDANSHTPCMYETYMRIIDEGDSIIPPALWLPVAKKENLFSLIDETVLSVASDRFFKGSDSLEIPLTFNISGSTFESMEFVKNFANTEGFAKKTIFEISSREMIEDRRAIEFFRECRHLGFRFSIDYFGGGAETIKAAKKMKFDFVKIDAFRFNIENQKDQKELLLLAKTAEALNINIIVERIEDKRMYTFCKKVGIPFVQGYFLAEPKGELLPDNSIPSGV